MLRNRQRDLLEEFRTRGILRRSEETGECYLLNNGNHAGEFFDFSVGFVDADFRRDLGIELMEEFGALKLDHDIDVIITPAMGGMLLAGTMQHLFYERKPLLFYTEKVDGVSLLRRFKLNDQQRVLLLDDVYNSGKNMKEMKVICDAADACVVGVAAIMNRNSQGRPMPQETITIPHIFLVTYPIVEVRPKECPRCLSGMPLEKDGIRVDYRELL